MSLSAQQMEVRRTRIGSSEIGALLGIDPFKSPMDVFLEKTLPANDDPARHQTWGLDIEPAILAHHARAKGYTLIPPPGTLVHPTLPLCATPDGLALTPAGTVRDVQAKNDQGYGQHEWGEPGSDDAPLLYVAQVQVELGLLLEARERLHQGIESEADIAASIRGAPPVAFAIKYDADLFGQLADVAAKFVRDHIATGKPPDGTPMEQAEYIRRRYRNPSSDLLEPTPQLEALVAAVRSARSTVKAAEEMKLEAENALKAAIGEASGVAGLCTWKLQKGSTFNVVKKPCRVLRLMGAKEE